ncbi:FkbM family methyltransferase [Halovulum marinum]|nr:FkbM family methyltransferase [Halovulum marinum]
MTDADNAPRNVYGRYCVPEGLEQRPAARAVLSGEVYEPDTLDYMRSHAGAGDIIHAGTFFGDFLPALSSALAPGALLWAFEANPASHGAAVRTAELNDLGNLRLRHAALSSGSGTLLFRTRDRHGKPLGGCSQVVSRDGPGVEKVTAVALDDAVPADRRISILQLDLEGHEKPALLGARRILREHRPVLILERVRRAFWLRRQFAGLGYRRVGRVHNNFIFEARPQAS